MLAIELPRFDEDNVAPDVEDYTLRITSGSMLLTAEPMEKIDENGTASTNADDDSIEAASETLAVVTHQEKQIVSRRRRRTLLVC